MQSLSGITHRDPDIQSGVPVFVGTRIPVRSLFDYLEAGFVIPILNQTDNKAPMRATRMAY
jgi:uncharacterized protein (DUF433 family)